MDQDTETTRKPLSTFKVSTRESLKNNLNKFLLALRSCIIASSSGITYHSESVI